MTIVRCERRADIMPMSLTPLITYFSGGNPFNIRTTYSCHRAGGLPVRVSRLTRSFISPSKSSNFQTSKFSLNRAPFVVLGRGVNPAEDASVAQDVSVFAHVVFPVT